MAILHDKIQKSLKRSTSTVVKLEQAVQGYKDFDIKERRRSSCWIRTEWWRRSRSVDACTPLVAESFVALPHERDARAHINFYERVEFNRRT